ncbi:MAG: signal peptidase I [Pseudomonadota bacterium]
MFKAFKERRPWVAAAFALVLSPALAMAYLGRGALAIGYLIGEVAATLLAYGIPIDTIAGADREMVALIAQSGVRLVGAVHGYILAGRLDERVPSAWFARWYSLIGLFILAPLLFALAFRSFLFEPYSIPSGSMLPTLQVGDYVWVSKYAYGYSRFSFPLDLSGPKGRWLAKTPERGDVVVFRRAADLPEIYLKRIVGMPGETVQMKDGVLHIDGAPVGYRQTDDYLDTATDPPERVTQFTETLPNGVSYAVLDRIAGGVADNTALFEVPPDTFFVMGDNRDNALDSRFPSVGMVPLENLLGRMETIY